MSISGAFTHALSGLTAASRAAELVSSNVANAMVEGYGARSLELSTRALGGTGSGVQIDGVRRQVDEVLIGDRRQTDAAIGYHGAQQGFLESLEQTIGTPDQAGSLSARVAQFEASLIEAAAHPESEIRLSAVVNAANNLATHINSVSQKIQAARLDADQQIAVQVKGLSAALKTVQSLNIQIQEAQVRGTDASGLMDLRQQAIDGISHTVPLKQVPRDNGMIALITTGGAVLLDGKVAELEFSPVTSIVPEMTIEGGGLSGLTINGHAIDASGDRSLIAGGSLAGLFAVRDTVSIEAQQRIDGVARDLIERFQNPSIDPTRALGDAGIFTDAGAAFSVANELGLSARIEIHSALDPDQGGEVRRIRDGLGSTVVGNVGSTQILNQLADAMSQAQVPSSTGLPGVARSASDLFADLLSLVSSDRLQADAQLGFASAKHQSLRQMELSKGVDTDAEMQKLMQIEQTYAANARVISTADEMIQTILAI